MKSGLPLTWRYFPLHGLVSGLSPWLRVVLLLAVAVAYLWVMTQLVGRKPAPHPVVPARRPPQADISEDEGKAA